MPQTRYPQLKQAAELWRCAISGLGVEVRPDVPTLRRKLSKLTLAPGVVDGQALEYFGYGACCLLAGALHELTDWPLAVAVHRPPAGLARWVHMGVAPAPGRFFDIHGDRAWPAVMAQYADYDVTMIGHVTLDQAVMVGAIGGDGWDHLCVPVVAETIRYFAEALVERHFTAAAPLREVV
ncbi:hypothetical protein [Nonomuraea gerenzanensis]|uniref:Uncharacterized protein n=1 Tax=Nonomuraea gerenzanensis TaxID=93944 RepID=A0A1M4BLD1_9ACTN|nr:hypothetical protein [Nonomuraea gerenzanensis]UBU19189.1 hypothetical protein LCN96_56315 [Nonomuraea gerenzanensis]SAP16362.1 hypothetical protein BN4615_P11025 [Nonomuraea gerenzanensis]